MQAILQIGLANAVMASVLALAAAGIGLFSPRPAVRHLLWLLVLLKLITPPMISIPVAYPAALESLIEPGKENRVWPLGSERGSSQQVASDEPASLGDDDWFLGNSEPSPAPLVSPAFSPGASAGERTITALIPFIFALWLIGTILWFAVAGIRIYRFQRLLRYGKAGPAPLQDEAFLLAQRLGLAHCPIVWLVPGRVSPLLWALGRKTCLVVPADLLDALRPEQRASLLAHELAHAKRRDHWVRWLEFLVAGLYWWLPVAWWARRQLQQAEEECCDAWVVWTLPAVAKAYAKALLQTVDFLDARPALPPVASGIGHVHLLKRRLTMIVRQPLCPCLSWPVHLAVIVLGVLFLPLAPQRLAAQGTKDEPAPAVSDDKAFVLAEQDRESRDTERRLRALEEKLDRLMQRLGQREEKPGEKPSGGERGAAEQERAKRALEKAKAAKEKAEAAEAKAWAKEKEKAEKAKEKATEKRGKESTWRVELDGKAMNPEQIERLKEEIRRKVEEALKKSNQELNEALKKSTEQLERAKSSLQQTKKPGATESRSEKSRDPEQRQLERRMDRLEQKMDRVIQALERQGKSAAK